MMFCRPSTAILLLAKLKIFLFLLHTLTLKNASVLPKFEFLPPRRNLKSTPNSLKFCTRHFFMHVPLFITSHLNFETKSQKRYTLLPRVAADSKTSWFLCSHSGAASFSNNISIRTLFEFLFI